MASLYPGWHHNGRTRFIGPDGSYTVRTLRDTSVQVSPRPLHTFYTALLFLITSGPPSSVAQLVSVRQDYVRTT